MSELREHLDWAESAEREQRHQNEMIRKLKSRLDENRSLLHE